MAIAGAGPSALAVSGPSGGNDSLALSLPSAAAGASPFGAPNPTLAALARKAPNFDRNRARICSFFAKGECKRGKSCPYRHELPTSAKGDPMAKQDYKDRYYGVNDPVAARMAERFVERASKAAAPPPDKSITTLFVGNLPETATEGDLRTAFAKYGALSAVRFKQQRGNGGGGSAAGNASSSSAAAFVTFEDRSSAESAARGLAGRLSIRGAPAKILWGKPAAPGAGAGAGGSGSGSGGGGQQGGGSGACTPRWTLLGPGQPSRLRRRFLVWLRLCASLSSSSSSSSSSSVALLASCRRWRCRRGWAAKEEEEEEEASAAEEAEETATGEGRSLAPDVFPPPPLALCLCFDSSSLPTCKTRNEKKRQ